MTYINYVSNKLRTVFFLIYKASSILDAKSLKIPYSISLFYIIDYCETWGNTYITNVQCLYLLQKRVIRNITHSEYLQVPTNYLLSSIF